MGAGDKRVNITAFSSGDRVRKFLDYYASMHLGEQDLTKGAGGRGHLGGGTWAETVPTCLNL